MLQSVACVLAGQENLIAIDKAGYNEVGETLHPQYLILEEHVIEAGAHLVDADEAAHAEGGGEKPGDALPDTRDAALRPADAGKEEQGNTDKDDEQHDVLAIAHEAGDDHAEEDAVEQVGQEEDGEVLPASRCRCALRTDTCLCA